MEHTAGKNLAMTEYLNRQETEKTKTEKNLEEHVINIFSELFKSNHKYGYLLNTDRNFLSTDQSTNKTLIANPKITKQVASPKEIIRDAKSSALQRYQEQAIKTFKTNIIPNKNVL